MKITFISSTDQIYQADAIRQEAIPSTPVQYWRALHDVELYGKPRDVVIEKDQSLPEVFRFVPDHSIRLTAERQWLWRNINPEVDSEKWRTFLGNRLAFTNHTGFPGHADHVNGLELDQADPALDFVRYCGGAIFTGVEEGNQLRVTNTVDIRRPLPSPNQVMAERRYFVGVNVSPEGMLFKLKPGIDVRVPMFCAQDIYVPLAMLKKIPLGVPLPSPYEYA